MQSLSPIIELLTPKPHGFDGLWFRTVGGAAEVSLIPNNGANLPACYVVRANEKSKHCGECEELITIAFDVVIGIDNTRTARVGGADDELLKYRNAVKNLLLGFDFENKTQPINFSGGNVMRYLDTDLFWADRYEVTVLIENYLPDPPMYDGLVYKQNETPTE